MFNHFSETTKYVNVTLHTVLLFLCIPVALGVKSPQTFYYKTRNLLTIFEDDRQPEIAMCPSKTKVQYISETANLKPRTHEQQMLANMCWRTVLADKSLSCVQKLSQQQCWPLTNLFVLCWPTCGKSCAVTGWL